MPTIAKTVHEGRTQPLVFTIKDSAGAAVDLSTYFKIGLVIRQGTRKLTFNTVDDPDRLTMVLPVSTGQMEFVPKEEDPVDPTYQAGDQGLHTHIFRLYTNDTDWFGVPDGKYLLIRAISA